MRLSDQTIQNINTINKNSHRNYSYIDAQPGQHTHTFIFLHGLMDLGENIKTGRSLVLEDKRTFDQNGPLRFPNVRIVFPNADVKATTAHNKSIETSWFDIYSLEGEN